MGDENTASAAGKMSSWFKGIIGATAGLMSGAFMMYFSPLLDKVVKPAKPVANFAVDVSGMTVTFYNRSTNGGDGWWDFGDGSPLEPVSSKQETLTHTYAAPGNYIAKLALRNVLNEESDRTVTLQLDNSRLEPPAILSLDAVPVSLGGYAPATFRVVSKAKNAKLCVWDLGDDQPLEISTEMPNNQDRLITFKKPGGYMIKLAAVNGDKADEKSTIVYVDEPPPNALTAVITVTDQATRVEKVDTPIPVTASFPPNYKENAFNFERVIPAKQGFEIITAKMDPVSEPHVRNLDLKISADKRSAKLTGQLVQEKSLFKRSQAAPSIMVRVLLTQESRTPASRPAIPVSSTMTVPGTVTLPLPPLPTGWVDPRRQIRLELRDGDRVVWQEARLPRNLPVTIRNRPCTLSAVPVVDQVRVELLDGRPVIRPSAN